MRILLFLALSLFTIPSFVHAQAWRDCVPNSIGPGGCDSIGPGGGLSIGPGGVKPSTATGRKGSTQTLCAHTTILALAQTTLDLAHQADEKIRRSALLEFIGGT